MCFKNVPVVNPSTNMLRNYLKATARVNRLVMFYGISNLMGCLMQNSYIYIYIYIHAYTHTHTHIYIYIYIYIYILIYRSPYMAEQKQDDQFEHTYRNYVRILM